MLNATQALLVLTALAQDTRLQITRALLRRLPDGIPAGQLADAVGCAASTVSFHMRQLSEAGLVRSRRLGPTVVYFAVPEVVGSLAGFLTSECCQGRPELCGLPPGDGTASGTGCGCGTERQEKPAA